MTYYSIGGYDYSKRNYNKDLFKKSSGSFFDQYFNSKRLKAKKKKAAKKATIQDKTAKIIKKAAKKAAKKAKVSYFQQYQNQKYNKNLFSTAGTRSYFDTYSLGGGAFDDYFKSNYNKDLFKGNAGATFNQYSKNNYNKNLFSKDGTKGFFAKYFDLFMGRGLGESTYDPYKKKGLGEIAYSGLGGMGKPVVWVGGAVALAAAAYLLMPKRSAPTFRRRRKNSLSYCHHCRYSHHNADECADRLTWEGFQHRGAEVHSLDKLIYMGPNKKCEYCGKRHRTQSAWSKCEDKHESEFDPFDPIQPME